MKLGKLRSGGLIATYRCTASCGHCIQNSSPARDAKYMSRTEARAILRKLKAMGCASLHIGGGEPFLDIPGLGAVIEEMYGAGVELDYVETNGFWASGGARDRELLRRLKDAGLTTLMLSLCPYHAAYVPLARVREALEACEAEGIPTFVWQQQFAREVAALGDESQTHGLEEYEAMFPGALGRLPARFGLNILGRAAVTHRDIAKIPFEELASDGRPCLGPLQTGHFHVDCYGDYIPPGCPGIAVSLVDAKAFAAGTYPAVAALTEGGIERLVKAALAKGFVPRRHYLGRCALCQHARTYLAKRNAEAWQDLRPRGFYDELPQG